MPEMRGYSLSQPPVCTRRQINRASTRSFRLQKLKHLAVVGQVRHVERDMIGDEALERGLAAKNLQRKCKDQRRVCARKRQQRVDQGVGPYQRPVQIDAQRPEHSNGCFRRHENLRQPITSSSWMRAGAEPSVGELPGLKS